MDITLPITSLLLIAIHSVGVAVSIYVGLKLLIQKNKGHVSVTILGILLILVGLTLFNGLLVNSGVSNRVQWLYFIPIFYSLSIGPLFYLFIKSKFSLVWKKWDFIHLILPIFQALVYFSIGFRSAEFKSFLWEETSFPIYLEVESIVFKISILAYSIGALAVLNKKKTKAHFWSKDLKNWLMQFAKGMVLIGLLEVLFSVLGEIPLTSGTLLTFAQALTLSAFAFWIAINGLKQYFPLQVYATTPANKVHLFSEEEYSLLENRLKGLMEIDQVFLNPDLNLELLANYLNISEKSCSHLLNHKLKTNFNALVNEYRVDEFKNKIKERACETYTLTALAYECGFNSKSTFNRVFKTVNGTTPSEYVKEIKKKGA